MFNVIVQFDNMRYNLVMPTKPFALNVTDLNRDGLSRSEQEGGQEWHAHRHTDTDSESIKKKKNNNNLTDVSE